MKLDRMLKLLVIGVSLMAGCGQKATTALAPEAAADAPAEAADEGMKVSLTAEQRELVALQTQALREVPVEVVVTGQAVVLAHDALAQVAADLRSARVAQAQSEAALKRLEGLASTPGAMGLDAVEVARRQAATDAVQVQLAQRKQQAQFGELTRAVPEATSEALADGRMKLVRVLFTGEVPEVLQAGNLRFSGTESAQSARSWKAQALWPAPDEGGVPGRSLFAVVADAGLSEGRRLVAFYAQRTAETGVLVPSSAVVVQDGQLWCYVQDGEDAYQRRRVDAAHATDKGYAQRAGFKAGEQVVIRGAGVLLARERGSVESEP